MEVYIMFSYHDGDPRFHVYTKEELTKELNEEGYENAEFVDLDTLKRHGDPNYWESVRDFDCPRLIIRGTVIVPREKEKVTEWSLDEEGL